MAGTDEARMRILVAEDDDHTRNLLCELCESWGHEPLQAEDGDEALEKLRSERVDLLVLDLMMPRVDGFSVLERIRENPRLRELPVIVLTAIGDVDGKIRGIELGADDYVTKPFRIMDLHRRMLAVIEKRRGRGERRAEPQARAAEPVEAFPLLRDALQQAASEALAANRLLSAMIVALDEEPTAARTMTASATEALSRSLSRLLGNAFRGSDRIYRLDDESFVILMPDTGTAGALTAAKRMQRVVQDWPSDSGERLSVSIGVAEFPTHGAQRPDELIRAASAALRRARRATTGIEVAEPEDGAPQQ